MEKSQKGQWAVVRVDNGIRNPHTGIDRDDFTSAQSAARYIEGTRISNPAGRFVRAYKPLAVLDQETGEKYDWADILDPRWEPR